jgi:hypothetical protein
MDKYEWILCPICGNETRVKIRSDTVLENFPLKQLLDCQIHYLTKCFSSYIILHGDKNESRTHGENFLFN